MTIPKNEPNVNIVCHLIDLDDPINITKQFSHAKITHHPSHLYNVPPKLSVSTDSFFQYIFIISPFLKHANTLIFSFTTSPSSLTLIPPTIHRQSEANRIVLKERSARLCNEIPTAKRYIQGIPLQQRRQERFYWRSATHPHQN